MNFNNDRTLLSFIILVDVYCVVCIGNLFTCSLATVSYTLVSNSFSMLFTLSLIPFLLVS